MKHIIAYILTGIIFSIQGFAQDCNKNLEDAQAAYDLGRLHQVEELLHPCLSQYDREEKLTAYRLLTIAHLYSNEDSLAEINMEKLLRVNPEYRLKPNDPAEFVELYKDFRTRPILILGGKAGGNLSRVEILKSYSLYNTELDKLVYTIKPSFQVGLSVHLPLTNHLEILTEVELIRNVFEYKTQLFVSEIDATYTDLTFTEKMLLLNIPVLARYNFVNKYNFDNTGLKPFIEIGGSVNLLLSSTGTAQRQDFVTANNQRAVTGADVSLTDTRQSLNYSVLAGTGVEYKQGRGSILLDIRIKYDLLNAVDPKQRYQNQGDIFKYGYNDRDFRLSSLMVSLGYLYPLYNPKKIR